MLGETLSTEELNDRRELRNAYTALEESGKGLQLPRDIEHWLSGRTKIEAELDGENNISRQDDNRSPLKQWIDREIHFALERRFKELEASGEEINHQLEYERIRIAVLKAVVIRGVELFNDWGWPFPPEKSTDPRNLRASLAPYLKGNYVPQTPPTVNEPVPVPTVISKPEPTTPAPRVIPTHTPTATVPQQMPSTPKRVAPIRRSDHEE